ncbi:MAG TPA: RAMP superfamily CRISPR-associated protein [Thermoanaerobaculia bacterium]|nr:RAMP superfamily CRISPR-associated protein [Thermoanaerobaculia bacterium]
MAQHGISRPTDEIVRHPPQPHDIWRPDLLTGILTLTFATAPGQFVSPGTGRLALTEEGATAVVAQQAARAAGIPVLPGSGIKGAVRTNYEILSLSCDPFARADRSHRDEEHCSRWSCCEACTLFGVPGWSGRVSFGEATPVSAEAVEIRIEEVPTPWLPHADKTRGDFRIYDLAEAVYLDEDTRSWQKRDKDLTRETYRGTFEGRMTFWNATTEELGRLLLAMGLGADDETRFHLRLGGVKYDGKGAVTVTPQSLRMSRSTGGRAVRPLDCGATRQRCADWIAAAKASSWAEKFWPTLRELARTLEKT